MSSKITKAQQAVLNAGKSTSVLVAAICGSISCLATFIGAFFFPNNLLLVMLSMLGIDLRGAVILATLIGMIPMGFATAALWMNWAFGRSKKTSPLGYTLSMVTIIFNLVVVSIAAVIVVIILFKGGSMLSSASSYNYGYGYDYAADAVGGAFSALLFLVFVVLALEILWYIKMLISVISIKKTLRAGQVVGYISMFVIVMNYIVAAGTIFTTIFGMITNFGFSTIADIAEIVLIFCVTIALNRLRRELMQPGMEQAALEQAVPQGRYQDDEDSVTVPMGRTAAGGIEGVAGMYAGAGMPVEPGKEVIIGRDESVANVVIKNPKVSRKHCGVRFNSFDGTYTVTDYSSNGLFYKNGQAFPKNTPVTCKSGTIFVIAQSGNEFRLK